MKVILDTNVFISGVFFSGVPHAILDAWRQKKITLVLSEEILEEYRRVGDELAQTFPAVDPRPALELLAIHAKIVEAPCCRFRFVQTRMMTSFWPAPSPVARRSSQAATKHFSAHPDIPALRS